MSASRLEYQAKDIPRLRQPEAMGFLPGGVGIYMKNFLTSDDMNGKKVFIHFEGVYNNSKVWINGHLLGFRPNGYSGI